jgi:hypothetical protein
MGVAQWLIAAVVPIAERRRLMLLIFDYVVADLSAITSVKRTSISFAMRYVHLITLWTSWVRCSWVLGYFLPGLRRRWWPCYTRLCPVHFGCIAFTEKPSAGTVVA